MSRGLDFDKRGNAGVMPVTGTSGEFVTTSKAGSAAWAQQPQVTHVGWQTLSLRAGSSEPQGSGTTKLDTPEALIDSNATMTARANRRTGFIVAP